MTSEKSRTYGHVILTGLVDKEEDQFVSYCRELGTASCGDTIDEALENLGEAIEVHLKGLEETGELRSVLRERNIRINEGPPTSDGAYVGVTPGKILTIYACLVPLVRAI